jgi:hypothetical protein
MTGASQQSFVLTMQARAKAIGAVACDAAFAGNPDKRRNGVAAAAKAHLDQAFSQGFAAGVAHATGARTK